MIDKINHYSFTTPASVHDEEAMTALELAGRVGAKMNETVEAVNEFAEKVTEETATHEAKTTEWLQKMDNDIAYMRATELPREVKSEVQRNINSGAFNNAIDEYAGGLTEKVNNLVENVPSGGTSMDAEIIDARMDAKTGKVYSSLAKSIEGQIDYHTNVYSLPFVENLFDASKVTDKMYVSTDGKVYTNTTYAVSPMIRVKGDCVIHFATLEFYEPAFGETFRRARGGYVVPHLATYDELGNFLSYYYDVEEKRYLGPDVAFIRFSVNRADVSTLMCSYFNPYLMWMESGEKLVRPEHIADFNVINDTLLNANLINPAHVTEGAYIASTNGVLYPNANNFCTGYIPIKYGTPYALFNTDMNKVGIRMYAIFDRTGTLIRGGENVSEVELTDYGAEPYFVRLTIDSRFLGECMFTHADATKYAEYGDPVIRESALPDDIGGGSVANLMTLENLLGGTFKRVNGTALSFPAYLHNFDVVLRGAGDRFTVAVGDTTINTERSGDEVVTYILIKCREGTATVHKVTTAGITTTTVQNVDSGDISCVDATVISMTSPDFSLPVWVVGDSYLGANSDRVYGQLKTFGCKKFMRLSRSGLDSAGAYNELVKALTLGTPKTLVWYVGINDSNTTAYTTTLNKVAQLCREKGVELILNRVPYLINTGVSVNYSVVTNSGYRYIDSCTAVSPSPTSWRTGTLSSDNVHPTESGARLLALQMLVDVPELMSYEDDSQKAVVIEKVMRLLYEVKNLDVSQNYGGYDFEDGDFPHSSFVVGETYTVEWDGERYECVAWEYTPTQVGLGNGKLIMTGEHASKGEDVPFIFSIFWDSDSNHGVTQLSTLTFVDGMPVFPDNITFSIYKTI